MLVILCLIRIYNLKAGLGLQSWWSHLHSVAEEINLNTDTKGDILGLKVIAGVD